MKRNGMWAAGLLLVVGCGSDAKVRELELRVAGLEKEIAEMKAANTVATTSHHPEWAGVALDPSVEKALERALGAVRGSSPSRIA